MSQSKAKTTPRAPITAVAFLLLLAAVAVTYHGILTSPFFFDDRTSIVENASIRHLGDLGSVLSPPISGGSGVVGRPLVNFSLALNYAVGGLNPVGYHLFNLGIHFAAALLLFGIARRTLQRILPKMEASPVDSGSLLAFAIALLWCLHPLATEAVTCVIQRTESLAACFYLLTLYAFIRGAEGAKRKNAWYALSWLSCLCGMATKEVMVTAPVVVFLYDRTFLSGSFAEAWRRRSKIFAGLCATWILLLVLVIQAGGNRGGAAGFGAGIGAGSYLLTQSRAILLYLKLSVWPHPLVVDYGTGVVTQLGDAILPGLIVLALLVGTIFALVRKPIVGFLGGAFFLILAPSSSIIPLANQTMAEHRMYLPLAIVVAGVVIGLWNLLGRRSLGLFLVFALLLGLGTVLRNSDYSSGLSIWSDTVAHAPDNPRAHYNLANELGHIPGRLPEAISEYNRALALEPNYPQAENNLGLALVALGKSDEAVGHYQRAISLRSDFADAHNNLGIAYTVLGKRDLALSEFETVLKARPDSAQAHAHVGLALADLQRFQEAIPEYQAALTIEPSADVEYNLGVAFGALGNTDRAIAAYLRALELDNKMRAARANLGVAYIQTGRPVQALEEFQTQVKLFPADPAAHQNLGLALRLLHRTKEAEVQLELAAQIRQSEPRQP